MFTNQRLLGIVLVLFIIGAISYFMVTKFKSDISDATASPSPSASASPDLKFVFEQQTPAPVGNPQLYVPSTAPTNQTPTPTPQPSSLPLEKNKNVGHFPGILRADVIQNKAVTIHTNKGDIVIATFPDVPQTTSNFLILAANGFYNGLTFHRVESGFVIQGGDPNGNGTGGPGYTFADEAVTKDYKRGIVAMANAGPNTNGSQFFIMLADHPELPKQYTIFGQVISGMDVVEKITVGDIMQKVIVQNLK